MAVVARYFSNSAAGAGDGTTWADRAALLSTGAFSTVITGFDFSGSDSLLCYIEGGKTYTITNDLAAADFSVAALTIANPLILHGCDSSGNALEPPDPDWTSDQPAWDDSALPDLTTTTNIYHINVATGLVHARLIKFTGSGRNAGLTTGVSADWCVAINSTSNASASTMVGNAAISNSVLKCTGTSYSTVTSLASVSHTNTRIEGVTGSSGNRHGVQIDSNGFNGLIRCTIIGCGGNGVHYSSGSASQTGIITQCTIANNGAKGILLNSTASQTGNWTIRNNIITGHSTNGIDAASARVLCQSNRLRDNGTNFANFGNYPTDFNYVTDAADADEYTDAGNGDYRIKHNATIAEMGYGVSVAKPTPEQVGAAMWDDTYSPHRTLT